MRRVNLMANDAAAQHRSRLAEERAAAERRIAGFTQSFEEIVSATEDVATDDEHDPEGHTIAWERQQAAALRDEAIAGLAELIAAEARLEAGSYGVCATCGSNIATARLEVLPATSTCVACAN